MDNTQKNKAYTFAMIKVAEAADNFGNKPIELGEIAASSCHEDQKDKKKKLEKSQIRGLQNFACSTTMVTDIKDYIKRQTGRHDSWKFNDFGKSLLSEIIKLSQTAENIKNEIPDQKPDGREINLLLIREFIKQLVSHYLYVRSTQPEQTEE
jgi:hypothetical protein